MNDVRVKSLFSMFAHEEYDRKYDPIVELAEAEVVRMLVPEHDPDDERVDFLAAAIANYYYQQTLFTGDHTYAGVVSDSTAARVMKFAEDLVRDYFRLCEPIIKSKTFVFKAAGEGDV